MPVLIGTRFQERVPISSSLPASTGNVDDEGTLFALGVTNITYEHLPHFNAQIV